MGSLCCCPCGDDFEEYSLPSNPVYRHCACLRYFFHQLFSGYSAQFQRLDGRSVPSPNQAATSFVPSGTGTTVTSNSLKDSPFSVARPSPFDADQRYSRMQRDGLISRCEKSMTRLQEDAQQVRTSNSATESLVSGKKHSGVEADEDCKLGQSETSEKELTSKVAYGLNYVLPSSEDEDVCPYMP